MSGIISYKDYSKLKFEFEKTTRELVEARHRYDELRHRVKNELHVFSTLFAAQRRSAQEPEHCEICVSRICAAAALNQSLEREDSEMCNLETFLSSLAATLQAMFDGRIEILAMVEPDIELDYRSAQCVGLVFAEAAMNALKHGFPGEANGCIEALLRRSGARLELTVANDGVALDPASAAGHGVGIMRSLARQLGGELLLRPLSKGTLAQLTFPAKKLSSGACDSMGH
jgi:two-component sensor histidine kinase